MAGKTSKTTEFVFDNGNEFKKDFLPLLKDFAIKPTPTTIKNPQANAILERVHQVLGDMLRTKNLQEYNFDKTDWFIDHKFTTFTNKQHV